MRLGGPYDCALLVVVDNIEEAVLWRGSRGRPHHEIVRVQVLEEVDSADVKVVVTPHLDELCSRVNAHHPCERERRPGLSY